MARANAGHAAGQNLAAFLHELRQDVRTLVVDEIHLLDAELADFLLAEILALSAGTPTRASRTAFSAAATRATFTAWAASMATFATRAALSSASASAFAFATRAAFPLRGSGSVRLFLFL